MNQYVSPSERWPNGVDKGRVEQCAQCMNATWDGDIINKRHRDELFKAGLINRRNGFNFISSKGIEWLLEIGVISA